MSEMRYKKAEAEVIVFGYGERVMTAPGDKVVPEYTWDQSNGESCTYGVLGD